MNKDNTNIPNGRTARKAGRGFLDDKLRAVLDKAIEETPDSDDLLNLLEDDESPRSPFDIGDAEVCVGGESND